MPDDHLRRPAGDAPRAVVIGGGATGCAVARDLALRNCRVTLIEQGDLGGGTSSRFHGMLQSGARYAVSDAAYAAECMRERRTIADLIPEAVEPIGGLFVALDEDPPEFGDKFLAGCRSADIPVEELDPDRVGEAEPNVSQKIVRAFSVPDATINPWRLVNALADDVRSRGGRVSSRHRVTKIATVNGQASGVHMEGPSGSSFVEADVIVNAAGAWSSRIAALVDQTVELQLTKGSIIVLAHRLVGKVINRCRHPTSHDIIVPTGTVSLFGTTSEVVDDPSTTTVRPEEIQELLDGAEPLIPGIRGFRALRAWAGVRPLVKPKEWPRGVPLPRRHNVIDHRMSGLVGFFTVCGGSLTTHRSMAEDVCDQVCQYLRWNEPCWSATTPLTDSKNRFWRPASTYEAIERRAEFAAPICECESIDAAAISEMITSGGVTRLDDLRRRLRIGFGPCQGTFCAPRVAGMLAAANSAVDAGDQLGEFWAERLKGMSLTAWGPQARQILLSDQVYERTLGIRLVSIPAVTKDWI